MLIRFKVSNFLSFCDMQSFSMISGNTQKKEEHIINDKKLKLLKFSAIYGANASGKSNLLKSIDYARTIILGGLNFNSSNFFCRINKSNNNKISTFDFEIKIKEKYYSYGFDILLSKNSIKSEWLYELNKSKNEEILIYTRNLGEKAEINYNYFNNDEQIINRIEFYSSDSKSQDNILFLTLMNNNKDDFYKEYSENKIIIIKEVYEWFKNVLTIISPQTKIDNTIYLSTEKSLNQINEIISTFGTGISKCKMIESSIEELNEKVPPVVLKDIFDNIKMNSINNLKNNVQKKENLFFRLNQEMYIFELNENEELKLKKVVLEHKNDDGEYIFEEESDGTRRLFDLIEILINDETRKKVYFIDELDRCLHPKLTYEFIKRFIKNENNNSTQLIVTTHESRLLNFDLLRRDEIWFTNREKNGPTKIYSLEDYNERFDKKIDKAYLEGRYGGVPIFDPLS